jgi:site-specific recombinase XerD
MQNLVTITPARGALGAPISDRAREYIGAARAPNTVRAYRAAWRDFERFCESRGERARPARVATIIEYLTALADAGARVSTIQTRLAAIAAAHSGNGNNPARDDAVRVVMQGIRRKLGCAPNQKAPITRRELLKMLATCGNDLVGKRDRALLLLGFAGAFRRSELAALNVEDVRFGADDAVIVLRRSKTDQEGHGAVKRVPMLDDAAICPVRALREWLDAAHIESGAVFRRVDRWGHAHERLTDRAIAIIVKRAAMAAGLDARQFAGHSLRAGFVTQAVADGTPEWAIAEVTGHKSRQVLQRYIRDAGRGQLAAIRRALGEMTQ